MFKDGKDYDQSLRGKFVMQKARQDPAHTFMNTHVYFEGKTVKEWTKILGLTKASVHRRLKVYGTVHTTRLSQKGAPQPARVFYKGLTLNEWSEKTGVKKATVAKYLRQFGHPYSKTVCKQMGLM
tara:strand:- start:665 stop:1039 length:375 start_codon:yes stop_codon:yes gene_type:complete